jgi:hypothetical protein
MGQVTVVVDKPGDGREFFPIAAADGIADDAYSPAPVRCGRRQWKTIGIRLRGGGDISESVRICCWHGISESAPARRPDIARRARRARVSARSLRWQ